MPPLQIKDDPGPPALAPGLQFETVIGGRLDFILQTVSLEVKPGQTQRGRQSGLRKIIYLDRGRDLVPGEKNIEQFVQPGYQQVFRVRPGQKDPDLFKNQGKRALSKR